jgi:hypothetical protein
MSIWSWKKCFLGSLCICGFYLLVILSIWWLFGWEIADIPTKTLYFGLNPNWLWVPMSTFYIAVCTTIIGRLEKIDYQKFCSLVIWSIISGTALGGITNFILIFGFSSELVYATFFP